MALLMKIDTKGTREDFRKIGLTLIGAGVAGILIGEDKVTTLEALLMLVSGTVVWIVGVVQRVKDADSKAQEER